MTAQIIRLPRRMTPAEKGLNSHWTDKLDAEREGFAKRMAWFRASHNGWTPGGAA